MIRCIDVQLDNYGFSEKIYMENTSVYGHAGVEYRNFEKTAYQNAGDWKLQPTATIGANIKF